MCNIVYKGCKDGSMKAPKIILQNLNGLFIESYYNVLQEEIKEIRCVDVVGGGGI